MPNHTKKFLAGAGGVDDEVGDWLRALGLGQYAELFKNEGFERVEDIGYLEANAYLAMGVKRGHLGRMQNALASAGLGMKVNHPANQAMSTQAARRPEVDQQAALQQAALTRDAILSAQAEINQKKRGTCYRCHLENVSTQERCHYHPGTLPLLRNDQCCWGLSCHEQKPYVSVFVVSNFGPGDRSYGYPTHPWSCCGRPYGEMCDVYTKNHVIQEGTAMLT
jgi:hypothetical protein